MNPLKRASSFLLIGLMALSGSAWAQTQGRLSPRQEKSLGGTLLSQDYFTADLYPEVTALLANVTKNHFDERVFRNFREGDITWAQSDCEYVLAHFSNHPGALHLYAEIGKKIGKPSLAMLAFETAIKDYPQYAYTHAQYGRFLVEQGAVVPGIMELQEALRLDPHLVPARAWLQEAQRISEAQPTAPNKSKPGL